MLALACFLRTALLVKTISNGNSSGLTNDTHNIKNIDDSDILGGLTLSDKEQFNYTTFNLFLDKVVMDMDVLAQLAYNATYSPSAEDIAVQSCFFDIQLTSLSPRNCIPPDVLLRVSKQPAWLASEKAVSSKPESFGY
ncbi:hypothetical protein Tco_1370404 [Tanacetum coccineum]